MLAYLLRRCRFVIEVTSRAREERATPSDGAQVASLPRRSTHLEDQ